MAVFRRWDGRSAPAGPQRGGGRRQPSFLAREECAPAQGKKVGGSRCRDKAGRRQTRHKERPPGWLRAQSSQRERRRISNATGRERVPPDPACHNEQGRHSAKHDTSGSPVRHRSAVGQERTGKAGRARDAVHRILRRLEQTGAVYGALFTRREAISESGALNRPRRNSGGTTASTASSFSLGSMRR
jgi:hypothetical protein